MKVSTNFVLPMAALLFMVLLVPQDVLAAGPTNCPKEPTRTAIGDGEVFAGSNCTIHAIGDIDEFTFNGNSGETYQLALGFNSGVAAQICLTLYDPNSNVIFPNSSNPNNCTTWNGFSGALSVVTDQALTLTGPYTMEITEASNATQMYAVSVERLNPFPLNAEQIKTLGKVINGDIAAPTDSNAFVFTGATTGEYEVTASLSGGVSQQICMTVYSPDGTLVVPSNGANPGCTSWNGFSGALFVQIDFTPTQAGQYMEFINAEGNDGAQKYTLEVSCLLGNCPSPYPTCTLVDAATYNATAGTLTMKFTEGNQSAATWNAWLNSQSTVTPLFSGAQPVTNPPKAITKTASVSPQGTVGILSTLTTPTNGIICSSFVTVNTGTP